MKNFSNIILTQTKDGIARLTLNEPETYNALSFDMIRSLLQILKKLNKDKKVKVIIIEGSGKGFSAGHNLKELRSLKGKPQYKKIFTLCSDLMMEITFNNKPVIASHSAVWDICEHPRNLKDDQIKSIGNSGGVICVNFASDLISEKFRQHVALLKEDEFGALDEIAQIYSDDHEAMEGALEELESKTGQLSNDPSLIPSHVAIVDHIEYIIGILGPAHVGIGSSFDGTVYLPSGLEDCTKLPLITEELIKRGHTDNVIAGILGENMLRVMADVIGS